MIVSQIYEFQLYFKSHYNCGSVFVNVVSDSAKLQQVAVTKLFRLVTNYGTVLKSEQFCLIVFC